MQSQNRLKELRVARDLKLYDVAALIRKEVSTVHRYESSETPVPDDVKAILAEHYGVTRSYLMGWDDETAEAAA